jgi:hypothetical protein
MTIPREDSLVLLAPRPETDHSIGVLTSWKDIAHFLGKGTRTVQRWEKEFGLPVRRPKRGTKSSVLAIPSEINRWVRSQGLSKGGHPVGDGALAEMQLQLAALQAENLELRRQLRMLPVKSA